MIELTKLNGKPFAVNADLIKFVEQAPDTVLTLVTGEKLVVKEASSEVMRRILEFRRSIVMSLTASTCSANNEPSNSQPAASVSRRED